MASHIGRVCVVYKVQIRRTYERNRRKRRRERALVQSPLALLIPVVAFFSGLMFSAIATAFTSVAPNVDFFNYPGFLYITPVFLLSGTFFPLASLPPAMQTFAAALLPLPHTVMLIKGLILGNLPITLLVGTA